MEKLERPSHPYPPGRLSPNKYSSSAELEGKRDSGLSCFSSGSSPPFHDPGTPGRKDTSTENIFFKGFQSEGPQQAERPRYLQPTLGNGGWEGSRVEEQPASRVSISGRPSFNPVWQVPEKKSQSPPPPPPPLRSDSFAATKVFPYTEGPSGPAKAQGRSFEKLTDNHTQNSLRFHQEKASEATRSFNPLPAKDFLHPSTAADHNHNQLHPNKLFSLSSNDIRQSNYTNLPAHQRQYSDESPLYLQTRSAPPTKIQSVGSYYRSLQDLPTNAFGRKYVRHSTASIASSAANQNLENGGHNRNYSLMSKLSVQTADLQARRGKAEGRTGEAEIPYWMISNEPGFQSSLKTSSKAKYSLPQSQMPYKERSDTHLGNSLNFEPQTSELTVRSRSPEDAAKTVEGHSNDKNRNFTVPQSNDPKASLLRHQDPWVPQEDHRISPLKTPLLHSLAQESRTLTERQIAPMTLNVMSNQEASDIMAASNGKTNRRSDRYATTLRNEIQQKRAQLQKSRSAATLTCDAEDEETEEWRSTETSTSSGVSFSNTYKDHLKEAQARVLQATSFQRRDLEPLGPEAPMVKASNGRIRGRKRFHLAKRTHSFSEPDKIDKVGVEGESQTGSLGEPRRFFDVKPAFSRPVLKSSLGTNLNADLEETGKQKERTVPGELERSQPASDPALLNPGQTQLLLDQQRLGTFAEYQASWNKAKKPSEAKTQGRYHSAENILDTDAEEKALCIHERSRSSPSADFYTQNNPSSWRDCQSQQSRCPTRGTTESRTRYQPDHSPQSAPPVPKNEGPVPGLTDHRTRPDTANPSHTTHSTGLCSLNPNPGSQLSSQLPQTKSPLPPPRPHLGPETTSSSQEFLAGAQADLTALQPLSISSLDTQQHGTAQSSSISPTQVSSPQPVRAYRGDMSRGGVENPEEEKELPPSSISLSSSWTPALSLPADGARSPSPQFAPLRLTDKPPAVFVQEDSPLRSENGLKLPAEMDTNSPVRKVPVRIVHTESNSEQEGRAYLPQNPDTCSVLDLLPHIPSLSIMERPALSLFSAYNRQTVQDLMQTKDQESVTELSGVGSRPTEEDAKREELARDIMGKDKSLVDILDQSGRMTTMDLMEGLFPTEEQILEGAHLRRRASAGSRLPTLSPRSMERREEEDLSVSATASLVPSSSYYNTSAPKAELLIKMKDMQEQLEDQDSEDELDIDLASKKQELISSLAGKLEVLREARHSLQEDVEDNEALGREVEATVQRLCQPNQLDKFRMFVGDLDKVVSLLLSLSGRLARVENALNSLEEEAPPEEKRTLTEKRKLLMRQHEDAKELKENLDRRERLVYNIMEDHLDAESLDDYCHFVKMKSALIIEQRKLEDKIKLGEEQLKCLVDSLPLEQRPLL
ncbi:protein Shroom2-like isoform X2 [Notolabrus celidotus]|uniref:protein Shroom2-like isoform X2 n=1 Tax=Notolabrus celidotus TaxID=1203425 RepID=UPI00148FA719|nr:protein Shroom2-like isoform X2 [Notolabrus celidotus]XP_034533578.1 protein Shroom2-like isoform X2 [Notolabrus celidotus]XP_034533579.1 protein Shroom2-like isoform X2 [Notolabrus celidotus]XP_034533580.1 protein Shroom2-like isoform X2 [Notolabrus celidotus]XP_034533581.1 protein Shroom2-like isoform X2 [Notolabrus celidotus]